MKNMAVTIKAYLHFGTSSQEIRRFSVAPDVSSSYDYLVEKVRQVFPLLLRKDFTLYWRDQDDEMVAFSSDEELVIALGSSVEESFRIYIREKGPQDSTDGLIGQPKAKHPGVVCDVCDKEIIGTRFKCLACPDYDLCSGCEGKGFHPEHEMLRIRTPVRHPWQGLWHMVFGPRGGHVGRGCHRRGGRHGFMPDFPRSRRDFRGACRGGCRGVCRGGFAGLMGGLWQGESASKSQEQAEEEKRDDTEMQQEPQGSEAKETYPTFEEVFEQVSKVTQQFLDPENYATWGFEQPDNDSSKPSDEKGAKKEASHSEKGEPRSKSEDESRDEEIPMSTESFVVLSKENYKETSAIPKSQEVTLSQRRAEVEEYQKKLNKAISQMEAMGFDNDNGLLGQLLIAKDFDIGKVIDTLQSK